MNLQISPSFEKLLAFSSIPITAYKSAKITLNYENAVEKKSNIQKMQDCYIRFTSQEFKTYGYLNGYLFGLGKTKDIRYLALYKELINLGQATECGVLSKNGKEDILNNAKQAMLFSKQIDQITSVISQTPEIKEYTEDLTFLYSKKMELQNKLHHSTQNFEENCIATNAQLAQDLETIILRINTSEHFFKKTINNIENLHPAFDKILEDFFSNNKYSIQDLVHFYAFKYELLNNELFKKEVFEDISKYIFNASVGSLSARIYIESKYGSLIVNLLEVSFLGDIDSHNNLSQYFLQTIFNLLNDYKPDFSLKALCIKEHENLQNKYAQKFAYGMGSAFTGSYQLNITGLQIINDILEYYKNLSQINIENRHMLTPFINFGYHEQETLKWNLIGGKFGSRKKLGLFYRIDKQLINFSPKYDSEIYEYCEGFSSPKFRSEFIKNDLPFFLSAIPIRKTLIIKPSHNFIIEKNKLAEIAKRLKIHHIDQQDKFNINDSDTNQIRVLLAEFKLLLDNTQNKEKLESYFEQLLGRKILKNFLSYAPTENFNSTLDNFIINICPSDNDGIYITLIREQQTQFTQKMNEKKINLIVDINSNDIDKYLNKYNEALNYLTEAIKNSPLYENIHQIYNDLNNLDKFINFYNEIKTKNVNTNTYINKLADCPHLLSLGENAIEVTRKYVEDIYKLFSELQQKIENKFLLSETEIITYTILNVLFSFINNNKIIEFIKYYSKFDKNNLTSDHKIQLCTIYKNLSEEDKLLLNDNLRALGSDTDNITSVNDKNILKNQNQKFMLNSIIENFKKGLESFTYIDASVNAITSFNKFRVITQLKSLINILQNFSKIALVKQEFEILNTKCFIKINQILDNLYNEEDRKQNISRTHDKLKEINTLLITLLKGGNLPLKRLGIEIEQSIINKLQDSYKELCQIEFFSKLNKLPFGYQNIFTNLPQEASAIQKLTQIVGCFVLGVNIKEYSLNNKDKKLQLYYKTILQDLYRLHADKLNSLNTIFYLHLQLNNNFNFFYNSTAQNAPRIANTISIIHKLLRNHLQNNEINLSDFSEEEINIIKSLGLYSIISKITIDEIIGIIKDRYLEDKAKTFNLISNDSSLINYIKDTSTMIQRINQIKIECLKINDSFSDKLLIINNYINSLNDQKTKIEKINIDKLEDLKHLALYFNNENNKIKDNGIFTLTLSSSIINKQIELFNLCFESINKLDSYKNISYDYSSLFSNKTLLEKAKNELQENCLNGYQFELFDNIPEPDKEDEFLKNAIINICNKNPNASLNNLFEIIKKAHKNEMLIKYYLNLYSYNKLATKLSTFYISHYFKLNDIKNLYNKALDTIINIKKIEIKIYPISITRDNFVEKFHEAHKKYQNYLIKSTEIYNKFILASTNTPFKKYNLKILNNEWQTRNIVSHEWLIKTFDIIEILDRIKDNDIPEIRIKLHIEALFEYIKMFYPNIFHNTNLTFLKINLQKIFSDYPNDTQKNLKDIQSQLDNLINQLKENPEPSLWEAFINFIKNIFTQEPSKGEIQLNIKSQLEYLNNKIWPSIFNNIDKVIQEYEEDLKTLDNFLKTPKTNIKITAPTYLLGFYKDFKDNDQLKDSD